MVKKTNKEEKSVKKDILQDNSPKQKDILQDNSPKQEFEEPRGWDSILEFKEELLALVIRNSKSWVEVDKNLPDGYRYQVLGTFNRLMMAEILIDAHIELLSGDGEEWFSGVLTRVAYAASFREGIPLKPVCNLQGRMVNLLRQYARIQREYAVFCSRGSNELVRPLRIQRISVQSFAPYGIGREFDEKLVKKHYEEKKTPTFYLDGHRYSGTSLWDEEKNPIEIGRFVSYPRKYELTEATAHQNTDELIVPDRPCILQVESPDEKSEFFNGDLFLIPEGVPVYIRKGSQHYIPFGLSLGAITSPVIFQINAETKERQVEKRVYKFTRTFLKWPSL